MLRIFISSTFRDLKYFRSKLLFRLKNVIESVGMEQFIPDGTNSHAKCFENLESCDFVIFFISVSYGSLINSCSNHACIAECPFKIKREKISYTHCEYLITISKKKPHITYIIGKDWNIINKLNKYKKKEINKQIIKKNSDLSYFSNEYLNNLIKVRKKVIKFRKLIEKEELYGEIDLQENDENLTKIVDNVSNEIANNIIKWYENGLIQLKDFYGRNSLLKTIDDKINESWEIYGIGGIGKTTLAHIILLIEKMKGYNFISIGSIQSYSTGSGYSYFKNKSARNQSLIQGENIKFDDVIRAFSLHEDKKFLNLKRNQQVKFLADKLKDEKILLHIDDYHKSDKYLNNLIKFHNNILITSRKKTNLTRNQIFLEGIEMPERTKFIENTITNLNIIIPDHIKTLISEGSEGHPITIEILLRNYMKINLEMLKEFRTKFIFSNQDQFDEFLERVISEVLDQNSYNLLKDLSIINTNLDSNINKSVLVEMKIYSQIEISFNKLIDSGFIKKKLNSERDYEFTFFHIKKILSDISEISNHQNALNYYNVKKHKISENIDDQIEMLYHYSKLRIDKKLLNEFISLSNKISPINITFSKLIDLGKKIKEAYDDQTKLTILIILGKLFWKAKNFYSAKEMFEESINIYENFIDGKKKENIEKYVRIKQNLAAMYLEMKNFGKAEICYNDVYNLCKDLYKEDSKKNVEIFAMINKNMGKLYYYMKNHIKAKDFALKALMLAEILHKESSETYLELLASIQNLLGICFKNLGEYNPSLDYLLKAKVSYEKLTQLNRHLYLQSLGGAYNNLAGTYNMIQDFSNSEINYLNAVQIFEELAGINEQVYLIDFFIILKNSGSFYIDHHQLKKAENILSQGLNLIEKIPEIHSKIFISEIASLYNLFGKLKLMQNKITEAENYLEKCYQIRYDLADNYSNIYLPDLIRTETRISLLHFKKDNLKKSLKYCISSVRNIYELYKEDKKGFIVKLIMYKVNLSTICLHLFNYKNSITILREVLYLFSDVGKKDFEQYPDLKNVQKKIKKLFFKIIRVYLFTKLLKRFVKSTKLEIITRLNKMFLEQNKNSIFFFEI